VLIIATAADCKKGFYDRLEAKASKEAKFIYEKLSPFSWAGMVEWEYAVAAQYPRDTICFVDTWDFIMQGSAQDVIEALGGSYLLFHSEATCWPEPHKADLFPESPTKARYLNGTGPCGTGEAIAEAISHGMRNFPIRGREASIFADNDQRFWTDVFLSGWGRIDYYQALSVSMNATDFDEFKIVERKLVLNTGITPAFVHANGASRGKYADILEAIR
jgi:hypothetical protein